MADVIDPLPPGAVVDLTNCDREPIHVPGSVQPHAVLLVLEEPSLIIRQASANAAGMWGSSGEKILGRPLSDFLRKSDMTALRKFLLEGDGDMPPRYLPRLRGKKLLGSAFEGSIHRHRGALILELETSPGHRNVNDRELLSAVRQMLSVSSTRETVVDFCQHTAKELRKFTGFDRVLVYRFDPDLSGHVIAEDRRGGLESYLGLHYPASDIPKQARELFCLSKLRLIPDVNYRSIPLTPALCPDTQQPLDMSFCVTRATSPIHLEYLRNMGVRASMTLSIVIENKLWGLIACHHCSPRYISHSLRSACDFIANALAILVAGREQAAEFFYAERLNEGQRLLSQAISEKADFDHAVRAMSGTTIGGIEADGAALTINGVVCLKGFTPGEAAVVELANHFCANVADEVWQTDRFNEAMPIAAKFAPQVCGILATRISREQRGYLFWFRKEFAQTVKWAGNPAQNKIAVAGSDRLMPRKSFALWQEQVSGRSRFWSANEISAARNLRHSFHELYATQTQALIVLNADLAVKLDIALQSLVARDEFLAKLSHELRTPLNPALLLASEEAENADLSAGARESFAAIRDNIELEAHLIDDLLDLSRISHGKVVLERKPLGLHAALRQALAILESEFASKPVNLVVRLSPTEAVVSADIVRLLQIFWNVLKNAIKFTPKDGTVTVESRIDEPLCRAVVSISDTGMGMTAEELPRIFEAFSQGDHALKVGTKKFGGLGLGLAITRSLLDAHGGKIRVESAGLGQGSTFIIEWPLVPSALPESALSPVPDRTKSHQPFPGTSLENSENNAILVVEDHAATRAAMAVVLKRRGYQVAQASSIKSALLLVTEQEFALIISDIGLTDGNGYDFIRQARAIRPATKAIALSGRGMEKDREDALAAGFTELILKPVNIQELKLAVLRAMKPSAVQTNV